MNNSNGSLVCALTCWIIAFFAGVIAAVLLMIVADWMFIQGAFIGALVFVVGGAVISWLMCRPLPPLNAAQSPYEGASGAPKPAAKIDPEPTPAPTAAPAAHASAAAGPGVAVKASPVLPGQVDLAKRKSEWKYDSGNDPAPAAKPAPESAPEPAVKPADDAATGTTTEAEAEPVTLSAARGGAPDDLKLLKGVGPKLEQTLNELGFYHFDQVAAWTEAHVAWVDQRLKFKGRIERDGWIDQAKILAAGGETEFSSRKKS